MLLRIQVFFKLCSMYRRRNTHAHTSTNISSSTNQKVAYKGVRTFTCKGIHQYIQLTPRTLQTQDREVEVWYMKEIHREGRNMV